MSFRTRPVFSDRQIIQPSDESITLSGSTNFVGTLKSKGVEIDATDTNAEVGYSLIYDENGRIVLKDNRSAGFVVEITFDELNILKNESKLEVGIWYKIIDFQTIHRITNTSEINIGPIEPLYIQAISEDQFSNKVYSDTFPNDIIEFDFTNQLCEDNTTPRKGVITFRKDIVNDTYTQYDWRHAKFRRWKITGKVTETVVKLTDTSFESNFVHFDIPDIGMAQGSERFFIKFESGITHNAGSINLTIKKSSPTISYTKPLLKWDGTSWNANELSGTEGIIVVCRLRNAFIYFNGRNYGNELIGTYASPYSFNFSLNPTIYYLVDSDDYVDYLTFNGQYKGVHFENSLQPEFGNVFYGNNTVFLSSVLYTTFVNRNDGNTFFEYTSDLTVAGNLTYCIFFKDIYNTVINDAQFSTFYTVLYILNVQNRIDASILYLHPFSSCELGEIEYSFIETFSSSNLGRSFVLNGKISFSFLSVGGISTVSNFPIIPNGTQTSSVNASKLTTFTFNGSARRSIIGWFNSEGITLSRVYNFESVWEVEKLQNVVDKLKIDNLVTPVGSVNLLGRDEKGNVVEGSSVIPVYSGAVTTILDDNLTANRAVVSDTNGKISISNTTSTEIGYLSGVTSSIQTQLNGKFNNPTGTTLQYIRGDGSLATFPSINDGQLTLSTSGIATGSQTFSANQSTNATFTVNVPGTNIAQGTRTSTTVPVTSSTGNDATLQAATTTLAGVMTAADKIKLDNLSGYDWRLSANAGTTITINNNDIVDFSSTSPITITRSTRTINITHANSGVAAGTYNNVTVNAQGHVTAGSNVSYLTAVNLGYTEATTQGTITNTGGSNAVIPAANTTRAGLITTDAQTIAGNKTVNGTVTATNFITTSDKRIKSEIEPIENALETISKFTSYEYFKNNQKEAGFIAQEIKEVLPYTVYENEDGYLTMSDRPILAYLHKAVLELKNEIDIIKNKLH
jgi:hypothetical protein